MANSVLAKMAVQISANTAEFNRALSKTQKDISAFTGGVSKIAGIVGVAFGVRQVASFALEISKLAGQAEGVNNAFNKLNNSKQLLIDLREATRGTVSELNLMQRAVQFANFGLELSKLPTLLEFATKRAQATGQSVDYLVESIVTGLGRRSVLILDNLGISAFELRKELAKVGDITVAVSNIIERDVANSGKIIETAAIRTERLSASWENFKVSIGEAANSTGVLGASLESLNTILVVLASNTLSAGEKIAFFGANPAVQAALLIKHFGLEAAEAAKQTKHLAFVNEQASEAFKKYNGNLEEFKKHITPGHKNTELLIAAFQKLMIAQKSELALQGTLGGALEEQAVLQKQQLNLRGEALAQTNIRLKQLDEEIKKLKELGVVSSEVSKTFDVSKRLSGFSSATIGTSDTSGLQFSPDTQRSKFLEATSKTMEGIRGLINPLTAETEAAFIDLTAMAGSFVANFAETLGEGFGNGFQNFGANILSNIAQFMKAFGRQLIAIGIGKVSLDNLFKGPLGGVAAIAAGVALTAAAGAIQASAQGGLNSATGGGSAQARYADTRNTQPITINVVGKISGRDIVLVQEKQDYAAGRGAG